MVDESKAQIGNTTSDTEQGPFFFIINDCFGGSSSLIVLSTVDTGGGHQLAAEGLQLLRSALPLAHNTHFKLMRDEIE
uniref:Uncharacterized protein n=1 Tax=Lotus japonicus TaxID=34305 RepID=I3SAH0_LOTJA|nr:unknown [Lotus japonicus]